MQSVDSENDGSGPGGGRRSRFSTAFYALMLLLLLGDVHQPACGETILFAVGEIAPFPYYYDSYVLPLSEPNDIAYARQLAMTGTGPQGTIVVAEITGGRDEINVGRPSSSTAWNWHVVRFVGFAEITIEILDGWPGFVESDVAGWLANTGGYIGFWGYTVVSEIGPLIREWTCDFHPDGQVNLQHLAMLNSAWLRDDCECPDWCGGADVDGSGAVDLDDLAILANDWLGEPVDPFMWCSPWDYPCQCHGDIDNDCRVYTSDISVYLHYCNPLHVQPIYYGHFCYEPEADFDRDGDIDVDDCTVFETWFGSVVPADCGCSHE